MAGISVTDTYDALLSTTLRNFSPKIPDQITTANAVFYLLKKQGKYRTVENLGYQAAQPVRYANASVNVYKGYDAVDVNPIDGATVALFDWADLATSIQISGDEMAKNRGENQLINLLEVKTQQAMDGITEQFNKAFLQGNGPNSATAVTTAYTDSTTGRAFIDPLPKLVAFTPTSGTVGSLNAATYTWWRNKTLNDASTTFTGFLANLRNLRNNCSKGPGGGPDIHIAGQLAFELYTKSLAAFHQNTSYQTADIPFDNVLFYGKPVTWDEFVIDAANGTAASVPVTTSDSWYMLNTGFLDIQVDAQSNFETTEFVRPYNGDSKAALVLWRGAVTISSRRKHGVQGSIDSTIAS